MAARTLTKDVNISLRLTAQMREDAERVAADEDMVLAEWVRHLIRERVLAHNVRRVEVRP